MGCTGEKTYEEAVKSEINRYLNGFNLLSSTKKEITTYINQDLKKKSVALENYQYLYREEDVKQTVEEYKILLWEKYSIGNRPYEIVIEENKDNDNKGNNVKKKENKKDNKSQDSENSGEDKKSENNINNNKDKDDKDKEIENNNIL